MIEHSGLGASLTWKKQTWTLGKPGWRGAAKFVPQQTDQLSCELACDGRPIAMFQFQEALRPHARHALKSLSHHYHLKLHILSGDQSERVQELASNLGIPENQSHGSLCAEQKRDLVEKLNPCLYLGDGMNDTLAFNQSAVTGTPVADRSLLDTRSDFLFTCSGLGFLPSLIRLSRWRHKTVLAILAFSITYNLIAISFCIMGLMNPLLAAVLMPLSSIACLLIARRSMNHHLQRQLNQKSHRRLSPSPRAQTQNT